MQSDALTVSEYLNSLPAERAQVMRKIRSLINKNLPAGYKETMRWGMISWEVPLKRYPNTYNSQPLNYIALAAQKNSYSLYLMGCYSNEKDRKSFEAEYKKTGKPMNMGKSCVRFKKIEDLPLEIVAKYIKKYPVEKFLKLYEAAKKK